MEEYVYTGKAMGTEFDISIVSSSKELADQEGSQAVQIIHEYEKRYSRFLSDSELSQLNLHKSMCVSEEFFNLIGETQELYQQTQGIFNPLLQIEQLGYKKSFDEIKENDNHTEFKIYDTDFSTVILDKKNLKITLRDNQKLDFGGFLKGYLAETLCKKISISHPEITGVIVNIGGDLHTQGLDSEQNMFVFQIYNPVTQKDDIFVPIKNKSLATSGTYKRQWKNKDQVTHHILDESGLQNPVSEITSASIIHTSGIKSEAYAKVFLSKGPEAAKNILKDETISFICITKDGKKLANI